MSSWRLDLRVGPIVATERSTDEGDYGPADGLTVTSSMASDELPPAWVTETAEFHLVAASAAELTAIRLGDPVSIAWRAPDTDQQDNGPGYDSWALRFDGQVTDVVLRPHKLGTIATVTAVDYLTGRLPEYRVTDGVLPQQSAYARLYGLAAAAGVVEPITLVAGDGPTVRALEVSDDDLLGLLEAHAVQYVEPSVIDPNPLRRMVPDPHGCTYVPSPAESGGHGAAGRDFEALSFVMSSPAESPWNAPGTFGPTPTGYGVVIAGSGPDRGRWTLPSGVVEFSAAWTQRKAQGPNHVRVLYGLNPQKPRAVELSNGDPGPRVVHTVTTELVNQSDALELAALYLPPYDGDEPWQADSFTWLLEHDDPPYRLPLPGDVVAIADIPPAWTPLARDWHAGVLEAVTFTLEGGEPSATVTIRPELPRFASDHQRSYTLAHLRAEYPTVTLDQLSPVDTVTDYRLLRGDLLP